MRPCKERTAAGGLQVDYFISHHWAEDFGEFVQSVLKLGGMCHGQPSAMVMPWELSTNRQCFIYFGPRNIMEKSRLQMGKSEEMDNFNGT